MSEELFGQIAAHRADQAAQLMSAVMMSIVKKKDEVLMPGRPKLHAETARHGQEATLGRG